MITYRIKGITDDVTTCECCGRRNLKRTVALAYVDADNLEGGVSYYGTGCAATFMGCTRGQMRTDIKNALLKEEIDRCNAADRARTILRVFEPVENASLQERRKAYRGASLIPQDTPFVTVGHAIARMLIEARTTLGHMTPAQAAEATARIAGLERAHTRAMEKLGSLLLVADEIKGDASAYGLVQEQIREASAAVARACA